MGSYFLHCRMSKSYGVLPTTIDADLEVKVKNYFVDIVCYNEHAEVARSCQVP